MQILRCQAYNLAAWDPFELGSRLGEAKFTEDPPRVNFQKGSLWVLVSEFLILLQHCCRSHPSAPLGSASSCGQFWPIVRDIPQELALPKSPNLTIRRHHPPFVKSGDLGRASSCGMTRTIGRSRPHEIDEPRRGEGGGPSASMPNE